MSAPNDRIFAYLVQRAIEARVIAENHNCFNKWIYVSDLFAKALTYAPDYPGAKSRVIKIYFLNQFMAWGRARPQLIEDVAQLLKGKKAEE